MSILPTRAISVIGAASIFTILVSFSRGVILARTLSVEEFGLALLIITISAGLDMMLDGGVDQFVVQSRHGARRDVVAAAQLYRLASGAFVAVILLLLASPLVNWLRTPEILIPVMCMALVPIIRGTVNLNYKKEQRSGGFSKEARIDIFRFSFEIITTLIFLSIWQSYWAAVAGLIANAIAHSLASNVIFGERWSFHTNRRSFRIVNAFSLPITFNSLLLFAAMQGDRFIIANGLNAEQVAIYAASAAFGQAGVSFVGRLINSITLSRFGAGQFKQIEKKITAQKVYRFILILSLLFGVGLSLVVPFLVPLVYGDDYSGVVALVLAISCVNALQVEQGWLTALLTSAGKTRFFPMLTAIRALSLPMAGVALAYGFPLIFVPLAAFIGTALGLCTSYILVKQQGLMSFSNIALGLLRSTGLLVIVLWLSAG